MFNTKLSRSLRLFNKVVRQKTTNVENSINHNYDKRLTETANDFAANRCAPPADKMIRDKHLANITVTSFYCQTAIEQLAAKQSTRLTPLTMMYIGKTEDGTHLLRSAQYLQKDLPIRFAHRIDDFRNLPFVVACNPLLLELHERFIKIFHTLHSFPSIKTLEQEKEFTELLRNTLSSTSDTLPLLVEGFRESKRHIKQETLVRNFLDRALTSRLAIKMLIEHHIALRKDKPNYIGAICMSFSPKKLVESAAEYAKKVCRTEYGIAPNVKIDGHIHSTFPYIATPLHYIIPEMLKNAFR
jgi:[3-methyl-2-oxobutanoate dehydrogenase (acetyl-transferring)] kinase